MNASSNRQVGTKTDGKDQKVTKKTHGPGRPAWNVYDPACPTRRVLDRIADKWTVLVVGTLARGTRRFGVLRKEVGGISQKVLTEILRGLERDGTVTRKVYASVPPKVEYSLTPLGRGLAGLLDSVREWAETNIESVLDAQQAYDAGRRGE
jgi:DNA-binding HxlR family transcriptional regulator